MAKRIAFALGVVLAVYMLFSALRGIDLIQSGDLAAQIMGVAVVLIPVVASYLIYREVRFGYATARIGKAMDESLLPTFGMTTEQESAYLDAALESARADESSWSRWYCVAIGYDLNNDRKRARESMRQAIALFQAEHL